MLKGKTELLSKVAGSQAFLLLRNAYEASEHYQHAFAKRWKVAKGGHDPDITLHHAAHLLKQERRESKAGRNT
jgi:outer membrane protein TolC